MIYYITAIEKNGNETVFSSHDNAELAAQKVDLLREEFPEKSFRIDTVPSNEERQAANNRIPAPVFEAIEENGDYTLTELFGTWHHVPATPETVGDLLTCRECGALVAIPQRHVDFHNKLLP